MDILAKTVIRSQAPQSTDLTFKRNSRQETKMEHNKLYDVGSFDEKASKTTNSTGDCSKGQSWSQAAANGHGKSQNEIQKASSHSKDSSSLQPSNKKSKPMRLPRTLRELGDFNWVGNESALPSRVKRRARSPDFFSVSDSYRPTPCNYSRLLSAANNNIYLLQQNCRLRNKRKRKRKRRRRKRWNWEPSETATIVDSNSGSAPSRRSPQRRLGSLQSENSDSAPTSSSLQHPRGSLETDNPDSSDRTPSSTSRQQRQGYLETDNSDSSECAPTSSSPQQCQGSLEADNSNSSESVPTSSSPQQCKGSLETENSDNSDSAPTSSSPKQLRESLAPDISESSHMSGSRQQRRVSLEPENSNQHLSATITSTIAPTEDKVKQEDRHPRTTTKPTQISDLGKKRSPSSRDVFSMPISCLHDKSSCFLDALLAKENISLGIKIEVEKGVVGIPARKRQKCGANATVEPIKMPSLVRSREQATKRIDSDFDYHKLTVSFVKEQPYDLEWEKNFGMGVDLLPCTTVAKDAFDPRLLGIPCTTKKRSSFLSFSTHCERREQQDEQRERMIVEYGTKTKVKHEGPMGMVPLVPESSSPDVPIFTGIAKSLQSK